MIKMSRKEQQNFRKQWGFKEPWIGIDFDGTLAKCYKWQGYDHTGEPVPRMVKRIKKLIQQNKKVKIFTSRAEAGRAATKFIHQWLEKQGLPKLEVTNVKDSGMVELWDDLAIKVRKNTGQTCCPYRRNWKSKIVY